MNHKYYLFILGLSASTTSFAFLDIFDSVEEKLEKCGYETLSSYPVDYFAPKKGDALAKKIINKLGNITIKSPSRSYVDQFEAATFQNNSSYDIKGVRVGYYSNNELMAIFDLQYLGTVPGSGDPMQNAGKH